MLLTYKLVTTLPMRGLLVFLLCVGWSSPAVLAQSLGRPGPGDTLALPPVSTDTAAVIHAFYEAKRQARTRVVLGTGAGILLVGAVGNVFGQERYGSYDGNSIRVFNLSLVALPVLLGELFYYGRYSRRHERRASRDFQAHKLAASLRAELKPKYFQGAK